MLYYLFTTTMHAVIIISIIIWKKKRTDIIYLSNNIEGCLPVNDYFTD